MGTWINSLLNSIWLSICQVIYVFINWLYQVFESVAQVNLFSTEVFKEITGRVYIVMGIAMLFIFAYNLILTIINPDDKKGTGAMSKVVKETIISLIAIILLPTIFNYMYIFQNHILSSNIIGQIIMGSTGSTSGDMSNCDADDYECTCDFSDFEDELKKYGTGVDKNVFAEGFSAGTKDVSKALSLYCKYYKSDQLTDSQRGAYSVAPTIFAAFYRPANYDMYECEEYLRTGNSTNIVTDKEKQICVNFFYDRLMSKYTGNIDFFVRDNYLMLTLSEDGNNVDITFDWLFAIAAGGLAVWMFLCYAMEVGVRVAKLGLLQIISPITVMMRIIPGQKEKIYDKWFKQLMNTYLDVFLRLIIIFFALFSISLVPDVIRTLFDNAYSGQSNWFIETLSMVIVILGILKFGQQAPGLLKEFFSGFGGGNFSLNPKKVFDTPGINAVRGAVYGATTGGVGGAFIGAGKGLTKGYNEAVKAVDTSRTEKENGSTFKGRMIDYARTAIGMETRGEEDKRKAGRNQEKVDKNNELIKSLDEIKEIAKKAVEKDNSNVNLDLSKLKADLALAQEFSGHKGTYQDLLATKRAFEQDVADAKTDAERRAASEKLARFSKALDLMKKQTTNEAVDALLSGKKDERDRYGFKPEDLAALAQEQAKLKAENIEVNTSIELSTKKDNLNAQIDEWSKEILDQYGEKYKARQADSRMVRNEGRAEKK